MELNLLPVRDAVGELVRSVAGRRRLIILCGAGVSVGAGIPAAAAVVDLLKTRFPEHLDPTQDYGYSEAFGSALPGHENRAARRQFIEELCSGQRPGKEHHLLASLLVSGEVRAIITTNFDHLLENALLSSAEIPVRVSLWDEDISRDDPLLGQPALLKVHGDFLFDDLANLDEEIARRVNRGTRVRLQALASEGKILVLGYSGGDSSVMSALEELIEGAATGDFEIWWSFFDPPDLGREKKLASLLELAHKSGRPVRALGPTPALAVLEWLASGLGLPAPNVFPFGIGKGSGGVSIQFGFRLTAPPQSPPTSSVQVLEGDFNAAVARAKSAIDEGRVVLVRGEYGSGRTSVLSALVNRKELAFYFSPLFSSRPSFLSLNSDLRVFALAKGVPAGSLDDPSKWRTELFEAGCTVLLDDLEVVEAFPESEQVQISSELMEEVFRLLYAHRLAGGIGTLVLVFRKLQRSDFIEHVRQLRLPRPIAEALEEATEVVLRPKPCAEPRNHRSAAASEAVAEVSDEALRVLQALLCVRSAVDHGVLAGVVASRKSLDRILDELNGKGLMERRGDLIRLRSEYWCLLPELLPVPQKVKDKMVACLRQRAEEVPIYRRDGLLLEAEELLYEIGRHGEALELLLGLLDSERLPFLRGFLYSTLRDYARLISKESIDLDEIPTEVKLRFGVELFRSAPEFLPPSEGVLVVSTMDRLCASLGELRCDYLRALVDSESLYSPWCREKLVKLHRRLRKSTDGDSSRMLAQVELDLAIFWDEEARRRVEYGRGREALERALLWARRAEQSYLSIGDQDRAGLAQDNQLGALISLSRLGEAEELGRRRLRQVAANRLPFSDERAVVHGNLFLMYLKLGEVERAEGHYYEAQLNNVYRGRHKSLFNNLAGCAIISLESTEHGDRLPEVSAVVNLMRGIVSAGPPYADARDRAVLEGIEDALARQNLR